MANGYLYVIKDNQTSLTKIGITGNWQSRLKTLKVGTRTECKILIQITDNREWEKRLHKKYAQWRLVGTEWFKLDEVFEQELISHVAKIGAAIKFDKHESECISSVSAESWWSTEEGREEAVRLIYNIEPDDITELEVSNPWLDYCSIPSEEEWPEAGASVSFSFWLPKSLGGDLAEVFVEPDGTVDGEYFDYEQNGDKWMVQSFQKPPKGIDDVIDRLWLLCDLDKSEWPLRVFTNQDKLKKLEYEAERKAGPPLPEDQAERERYLMKIVNERTKEVSKDFDLSYIRSKIKEEWTLKGLNVAPDNPLCIYNEEIFAEAELRYAKGFRVSRSEFKWCKIAPDGKWIDCTEEDEASF